MGIRPRVAKHLWENRQNNQMDLIPYDQDKRIIEAQTAKTKYQKTVKMLTAVEQATEIVKSKIKRERKMAECKTFVPPEQHINVRLQFDPRGLLVTQKVHKINERPELSFADSRCDLFRRKKLSITLLILGTDIFP